MFINHSLVHSDIAFKCHAVLSAQVCHIRHHRHVREYLEVAIWRDFPEDAAIAPVEPQRGPDSLWICCLVTSELPTVEYCRITCKVPSPSDQSPSGFSQDRFLAQGSPSPFVWLNR